MTTPAVSTTRKYSGPVLLGFHANGMAGSGGTYLQQQCAAAAAAKIGNKLPVSCLPLLKRSPHKGDGRQRQHVSAATVSQQQQSPPLKRGLLSSHIQGR